MDILSAIFLIIILIFLLVGTLNGFIKTLLIFSKGIVSYLIASLFSKPLANLLLKLPFTNSAKNGISNWIISINPSFGETIMPNQSDKVYESMKSLPLPNFITKALATNITSSIPSEGITIANEVSYQILLLLFTILSFIILIVATRILLQLFSSIIKKFIDSLHGIKVIDRIFGIVLGLFLGICIVDLICICLTGIMNTPFLSSWGNALIDIMKLNEDNFTISKFMYEHNLLLFIISLFF